MGHMGLLRQLLFCGAAVGGQRCHIYPEGMLPTSGGHREADWSRSHGGAVAGSREQGLGVGGDRILSFSNEITLRKIYN